MRRTDKEEIRENLRQYVAKFPSQNKAAQSLQGTSAATVSSIVSGKFENISDEMFKKIASQLPAVNKEWRIVETTGYQEMNYVMKDAQESKSVTWMVGEAGCGKTTSAKSYSSENAEAFLILCSEDMRKSDFIRDIAKRIGIKADGHSIRETLELIIDALIQMKSPLLIFDEADKLTERVFHYFIDLYNRLEDRCGIVFFSTSHIKRRMETGLRYNKCGYNEIYSRIGRKFFDLEQTSPNDVYAIATANGVTDKIRIGEVIKDTEGCDFDLRRVKKAVHRAKLINNSKID